MNDAMQSLKKCIGPVETGWSLPPAWYVSEELYELEQAVVFRSGWVGVGRSDRWRESGDFSAMTLAGVPLVVVRDDDGNLRAYANSCSHRGAQVMVGEGSCARMRCPFHFWTYGLDGRLVGAPSMNKTTNFDKADHGLGEFALAERFGFVFVSFEPDPPSIDEWFGDFGRFHEPWPIADLVMTRRRELVVDCNWKPFAEVFNEYYHLPYVHPGSIDSTYDEPDDPDVVEGRYATHFGTTEGTGGLLVADRDKQLPIMEGLEGRAADGVRYTWLFPNIIVAVGSEAMWMYELYPEGPHRVRCAQAVCFPQATIDSPGFAEKAEAYYERFDVAIAEDIPVLVRQHAGLKSPFAKQGRYSYLEPSVARFAGWYAERILATER